MLLSGVEVDGRVVDVTVRGETIEAVTPVGTSRPQADDVVVHGAGAALVPGLHDHHVHLLALAARAESVECRDLLALRAAAAAAPPGSWLRGVGYDGALDRWILDAVVADRPVRVQHRSGHLWVLNSAGAEAVGLAPDHDGRLFGADRWLRARIGEREAPPSLREVGRTLAAHGVTGVTDTTPDLDEAGIAALDQAVADGSLPQGVVAMAEARAPAGEHVRLGAVKVMVSDHDLPALDDLVARIAAARAVSRPVAFHCVTRESLLLALSALEMAGAASGDRIEHASVAPPEAVEWLGRLGIAVVTQHNFIGERGDHYLAEVDVDDQPWLYRGRGFLDAGVPLGGGTDAPVGAPDPWAAMRAAVERRAPSGRVLGGEEALTPEEALRLFTTAADQPGGDPRRVAPGSRADLCLLAAPWREAREVLSPELVVLTITGGRPVWPGG